MIRLRLPFKKKPPEARKSVLGLRRLNRAKFHRISKKKIMTFLTVLFITFLFLAIFFMVKNNPFRIKNINFKNTDLSCVSNEQLRNYLNLANSNIFNISAESLQQKAKQKFKCLSSITIQKKFPETLEIEANDRKLAAVIKFFQLPELDLKLSEATASSATAIIIENTQGAKQIANFIVDNEGTILKLQADTSDLPEIEYYHQATELKLGAKIPEDAIAKSLKVINLLTQQGIVTKRIKIIESGLFLSGEKELAFSLRWDIDRQIASLQLILHQAMIDSREVKKIDLRFEKAIVVYSVPNR